MHRLFYDETLNFIRPLRQKEIFMGFLSGLFHSRDKPTNSTNGNAYRFLFGGSNSSKAVNERSAMQMTAVYACVRILSESIAELPVHVYKYTDSGSKEKAIKHPLYRLIHDEPNLWIGDALLQKTYTTDFLNKIRVKNDGLVPQYYVEGNHEAIIPKEIYLQVQKELVRRQVVKTSANGKKRSYSCNHCFSQIVICGECNEMFRRLHWNNRGVKSIVWRCISRLESTGLECHARTINELVLQDAVVKAINQMLGDKSSYQAQLQLNIASVIRASQATSVENIAEKLMALQQELIQKAQSKETYDEIADEIFRLRELRQQTTVDTAARDKQIKRINDLQDYISQQTVHLTEFDESLVRRWVKQITIWDDRITVELKSGVSIDVDT